MFRAQGPAKLSISVSGLVSLLNMLSGLEWFSSRELEPDTISSNHIRAYIKDKEPHPAALFPQCFSSEPPLVAITYEWRLSFKEILTYLNPVQVGRCGSKWGVDVPTSMAKLRVWIDVFFIDQLSNDIASLLQESRRVYEEAAFHLMLVTPTIFTRAWCLYEFAVRRMVSKETLVLESTQTELCQGLMTAGDFFHGMSSTMPADKERITTQILEAFGNPKRFDMEMLSIFVAGGGRRVVA